MTAYHCYNRLYAQINILLNRHKVSYHPQQCCRLCIFLSEQVLLQHAATDRMIKVPMLLESSDGDVSVEFLKRPIPRKPVNTTNAAKVQNWQATMGTYSGRTNFILPISPSSFVAGSTTVSSPAFKPTWRYRCETSMFWLWVKL